MSGISEAPLARYNRLIAIRNAKVAQGIPTTMSSYEYGRRAGKLDRWLNAKFNEGTIVPFKDFNDRDEDIRI